jgi:hypothetical protein
MTSGYYGISFLVPKSSERIPRREKPIIDRAIHKKHVDFVRRRPFMPAKKYFRKSIFIKSILSQIGHKTISPSKTYVFLECYDEAVNE